MTRLAIHVSQGDIQRGVGGSHASCAIALAIARRFKGEVKVGLYSGFFIDKIREIARCGLTDGKIEFHLPIPTRKWISDFDHWKNVEPSVLYLDVYTTATTQDLSRPEVE